MNQLKLKSMKVTLLRSKIIHVKGRSGVFSSRSSFLCVGVKLLLGYFAIFLLTQFLLIEPAGADANKQTQVHWLVQGNHKRFYEVHFPKGYRRIQSSAVVLGFHGGGGNAAQFIENTAMNEIADRYGFIAVYPQGTAKSGFLSKKFRTWNAGACCGPAMEHNIDDVAFVAALIDDLERRFNIDRSRVYATGISNGAQMSYRLACELSDRITAVAAIAGQGNYTPCKPERAVPVLHIHGTEDTCALFDSRKPRSDGHCPVLDGVQLSGGCFQVYLSKLFSKKIEPVCFPAMPVEEYLDFWRENNACSAKSKITLNQGAVRCESSVECASDAEVTLCTIRGGGHIWPGAKPTGVCRSNAKGRACRLWEETVGSSNNQINAGEIAWQFFRRHSL